MWLLQDRSRSVLVTRIVDRQYQQVVSEPGCRVCWLSRIDQEGFTCCSLVNNKGSWCSGSRTSRSSRVSTVKGFLGLRLSGFVTRCRRSKGLLVFGCIEDRQRFSDGFFFDVINKEDWFRSGFLFVRTKGEGRDQRFLIKVKKETLCFVFINIGGIQYFKNKIQFVFFVYYL